MKQISDFLDCFIIYSMSETKNTILKFANEKLQDIANHIKYDKERGYYLNFYKSYNHLIGLELKFKNTKFDLF